MKTTGRWCSGLAISSILIISATLSSPAATAAESRATAPQWQAKNRSEHQTEWATVRYLTNADTGRVRAVTNSFIELGTGLNRRDAQGRWQQSNPAFEITATGAEANGASHRVTLTGNINTQGAVQIEHDGVRMQGHPLCVAYYDPVDGRSELLAELTDAAGWLVSSNEIVFSNCFKGLRASIRYRNFVSGMEQDLLLHERPPVSPEDLGFSDKTRLELFTEWIGDTPLPQQETRVLQREKDAAVRQQMVEPDFSDATLTFGDGKLRMAQGRAFTTGDRHPAGVRADPSLKSVPVGKRFEIIGGRKILIEAVPLARVQPMLDKLPAARAGGVLTNAAAQGRAGVSPAPVGEAGEQLALARSVGRRATRPTPDRSAILPAKRLAQTKIEHRVQTASANSKPETRNTELAAAEPPTFVLDWLVQLGSGTLPGYTFHGTNTYHITGPVTIEGPNPATFIGGTVLKFDPWNTSASISILGPVVCDTSEYRPAIFTGKDDNSIGEFVPGSNGTPGLWGYGGGYLHFYGAASVDLKHLRVRYSSGPALSFFNASAANRVSHSQFVGSWSLFTQGNTLTLLNVLFDNVALLVEGADFTAHAEHVTARTGWALADDWGSYSGDITFLNSLLVNLPYCWANSCSVPANSHWSTTDEPALWQTAGAGNYYLANGSTHRDAGTAEIDGELETALARMTTYPPETLTGSAAPNLILGPRPIGDSGPLDRGYHYPRIDYALDDLLVEDTSVLLTNGVVLTSIGWHGFWLKGGLLVSEGTPATLNRLIPHTLVQEQSVFWNNFNPASITTIYPNIGASQAPSDIQLRFTSLDKHQYGGSGYHFFSAPGSSPVSRFVLRDSEVVGGVIELQADTATTALFALTNTVFQNVALNCWDSPNLFVFNNLFLFGEQIFGRLEATTWALHDNLFHHARILDYCDYAFTHTHNAFVACYFENSTTTDDQMLPPGTGEFTLSDLAFEQGPFGKYYLLPSATQLINQGSRTAAAAGMYHYTTRITTGSKDGTDPPSPYKVDIGLHYVGANSAKLPIDSDGEGLPDYTEDVDGDGFVDSNETSYSNPDTDGDGISDSVEPTLWRSPLQADANAVWFTPRKN